MGMVFTHVVFEGRAPRLSQIADKVTELSGLPMLLKELLRMDWAAEGHGVEALRAAMISIGREKGLSIRTWSRDEHEPSGRSSPFGRGLFSAIPSCLYNHRPPLNCATGAALRLPDWCRGRAPSHRRESPTTPPSVHAFPAVAGRTSVSRCRSMEELLPWLPPEPPICEGGE